uniref:FBD domain-containing protein n=1 Tax=Panagrellus redivivus TaxID=6233 RepID=A0A7E4W1R8_PANRE
MMSVPLKPHLTSELGEILFDRFLENGQQSQHALTIFAVAGRHSLYAFAKAAWRRVDGSCMDKRFKSNLTAPGSAALSLHFLGALTTDFTVLELPPTIQRALFGNKFIVDLNLLGRFRSTSDALRLLHHWPNLERLSCDLGVFLRLVKESDLEMPHLQHLELDGHRKPFNFRLSSTPRIPFPETLVLRCSYKSKSGVGELFSPITQFPGVKHLELRVDQHSLFTAADFLAIDALIAMFPNLESVSISIRIQVAILDDFKDVIPLLNVLTTSSPRKNVKFAFKYWGRARSVTQNYRSIFEDRGFSIKSPGVYLSADCSRSHNFLLHMVFCIPSSHP